MANKCLFGIAVLISLNVIVQAKCPNEWVTYADSCYFFGGSSLTFQEAEEFCWHYGAHLVHLETRTENIFIKSHLSTLKDPKHWIGLKDAVIEDLWTWYDTSTATTFTNWSPGEPNAGRSANCAAIWESHHYNWVDESCSEQFKTICEKRDVSTPCTETVVG